MKTPETQNWRQDLLGREKELEWLQSAWKEAVTGKPQIRVITAESGYGKTKIIHAFFAWLACHHDPNGYWPKWLPASNESLSIMPEFSGIETKLEIPWFWWGSRWENPQGHNRCITSSPLLLTKEEPAFEWQCKSLSAAIDDNKALGKASISAMKAILSLIPSASLLANAATAFSDIKDAYNILTIHKNDRILRTSIKEQDESKIKEFLATSSLILGKDLFGGPGMPMVLILDDAQWMDPLSLMMVRNLWQLANEKKWRLLIIGTHWERDWNEQILNDCGRCTFASWTRNLQGFQTRSSSTPLADSVTTIAEQWRLGKLEEVDELLKAAFKGLTEEQIKMFTERVSGNPLHMQEVIRLLANKKDQWFIDDNLEMPLKDDGFRKAMNYDLKLESLERDRFDATAISIKKMIGAGSAQGARFINHFASDVAAKLGLEIDNLMLLEEAIDPLALAERSGEICTEFRSRTIQMSAHEFLRDTSSDDLISKAIIQSACEWSISGKLGELGNDLSSRLLSLVHDYATNHTDHIDDIEELFEFYFSHAERQYSEFYNSYAAYATYELAIDLARAIESRYGPAEPVRHLHAKAICLMGNLGNHCESYPPASVHFKKCLELCEENLKLFGNSRMALRDYSRMALNIGHLHVNAGDDSEAQNYYLKSHEISNLLISKYGATSENLYEHILSIKPLGKSRDYFLEQLQLIDRLRALEDTDHEHIGRIIYAMELASNRHEKNGDHEKALVMRRETLQLAQRMFSENSDSLPWLLTLTEQYYYLSQTLKNLDLMEECDALLKTAHSHAIDYSQRSDDLSGDYIKDEIEQALGLFDFEGLTPMSDEEIAFFNNINQESIGL